jgi:hypothetical protein
VGNAFKLLTLFFLGALVVLVVTHPKGFATSAGSLFTGVNSLGLTLAGEVPKGAYQKIPA